MNNLEAFEYTGKLLKDFYSFDLNQYSRMEIAILIDLLSFSLRLSNQGSPYERKIK
jgi:hypothetical protein